MDTVVCKVCGCALPKTAYGSSAWKKRTLPGGISCKKCVDTSDWFRHRGATHPVNGAVPHPATIEVSHVLVKFRGVEDPTSFRDPDGALIAERSVADAVSVLERVRARLEDAENLDYSFGQAAKEQSECNSAMNRGFLKMISRGQMHVEFEECAFRLDVGDLSSVCTSPSGAHLIYRHR